MSRLGQSTRLHLNGLDLHAERATDDGYVESTLDLSKNIGNHEGKLVVGTKWKSNEYWRRWAPKDLQGTVLRVNVRYGDMSWGIRGTWRLEEVDLDPLVYWDGAVLKFGTLAAEDEEGRHDIRLLAETDRPAVLDGILYARLDDKLHQLDLNRSIGNHDGKLEVGGENFSMSTKDVVLDGTVLKGKPRRVDHVWDTAEIDLSHFIARREGGPTGEVTECVFTPTLHKSYRQVVLQVRYSTSDSAKASKTHSAEYVIYNRADLKISSKSLQAMPRNSLPDSWYEPEMRWSLVHSSITNCTRNHGGDCRREAWSPLPARVLDLTAVDRGIARLIITNGECERYACASYRWSSATPFTLTMANQHELQSEGVKTTLLPQSIQTVIDVCLKLGLRYLWVDSLCIQQDSKADWQVESQNMASYYGNCFICIATTSNPDADDEGKPFRRPNAIKLTGTGPDGLPFRLLAVPLEQIDESPESQHFTQLSEKELDATFPLLKRGWVYQERKLAPRILHLCKNELVYECGAQTWCECGHCQEYQINWTKSKPEPPLRLYSYGIGVPEPEGRDERKAGDQWRSACAAYSTLDLTFASDRLPAISGFAKSLQLRGRYLAGLWQESLLADLCWYVGPELVVDDPRLTKQNTIREGERQLATKPRSQTYIAPSWSWASVEEPITFLPVSTWTEPTPYITLLEAGIVPESDNPMGAVTPASHLKLRCKLLETAWTCSFNKESSESWYKLTAVKGMQGQFGMFPFAGKSANRIVMPGHPDEAEAETIRFTPDYNITISSSSKAAIPADECLFLMPMRAEIAYLGAYLLKDVDPEEVIIGRAGGEYAPSNYAKVRALVLRQVAEHELLVKQGNLPVFERVGFTWYFARKPLEIEESPDFRSMDIILV
ncbi:heterokaryon incompatibility protein-domain-containing protein [Neohortaea acidophila]|uniref:Heterokaryon incompatibility protein-domain-containing protein n=1 Tax=Neohortaea acidophila TaxID=245834 RepID=A0A6A6PLG6_9PEZI|nr:heterokaryon incompatibility protein-domain-containing protein [Neohortaea acidophila]KAF2480879.1 heterokaryon incompatibility protein-domain-containing protein [Neohortaea acidophila]